MTTSIYSRWHVCKEEHFAPSQRTSPVSMCDRTEQEFFFQNYRSRRPTPMEMFAHTCIAQQLNLKFDSTVEMTLIVRSHQYAHDWRTYAYQNQINLTQVLCNKHMITQKCNDIQTQDHPLYTIQYQRVNKIVCNSCKKIKSCLYSTLNHI